jgi:uncharacterized protein (TIGR00369 family)
MKLPEGFKELPRSDAHNCFGCSPSNPHGLQMTFRTDETAVFSDVTIPSHLCGWSNLAHGGVLFTILDEIMSWTAMYLLRRITVTQSMQIDFIKPVTVESSLAARGAIISTSGNHDVRTEGEIRTVRGDLCARARADFKVFSPAVARRLKIADDASLEWFAQALEIK